MTITIISLFPDILSGFVSSSMIYKAQKIGATKINLVNLRDYGEGQRKTVDDTPYGGGDGMLLKVEPLYKAIIASKKANPNSKVLLMTPRGYDYNQSHAKRLAKESKDLIIVCGRYEGFDERITEFVDEQISVGHFVLTGGEIPAMVVADSVVRLLPGVLGGELSAEIESFSEGDNREYPQYTRPENFNGLEVPSVLLSGNHQEIALWREEQSKKYKPIEPKK
jgi:tRNA (guanine37-N1)-methyltransferase